MAIRFEGDGMPSRKDLIDQAAGVGIKFPEDSLQEIYFLDFCRILWSHGYTDGVRALSEELRKKSNHNPIETDSVF